MTGPVSGPVSGPASDPVAARGGAPVGVLADLDVIEACAVLYLRLWNGGAAAQRQMLAEFGRAIGPDGAQATLNSLGRICDLCARHGRRPIMRHGITCKCLGSDEACFTNLVMLAARGDREDAMLIATLMVRPDMAPALAGLAQTFGLGLTRLTRRQAPAAKPPVADQAGERLH